MDKNDIVQELDILKMKIMLDSNVKEDIDEYEEWVDEMHCKIKNPKPLNFIFGCPKRYEKYSTIRSLVQDLFYKKHSDQFEYHKYQPEIREIINEVVAMVMFIEHKENLNKK